MLQFTFNELIGFPQQKLLAAFLKDPLRTCYCS